MDVSREEFYRAVDELKSEALRTRETVVALRGEVTTLALGVAIVRQDVEALKASKRDYREWVAMSVIGAVVAGVDYLIHRFSR